MNSKNLRNVRHGSAIHQSVPDPLRIVLWLKPRGSLMLWEATLRGGIQVSKAQLQGKAPSIGASALKGAFKRVFELLHPEMCCEPAGSCQPPLLCGLCSLFGTKAHPGKLRFSDAVMVMDKNESARLDSSSGFFYHLRGTFPSSERKTNGGSFGVATRPSFSDEISFRAEIHTSSLSGGEKKSLNTLLKELENTGLSIGKRRSAGLGFFVVKSKIFEDKEQATEPEPSGKDDAFKIELHPQEDFMVSGVLNKNAFRKVVHRVPGNMVRSALKELSPSAAQKLVFSFFYPARKGERALPLPLSAVQCIAGMKHQAGFKPHGMRDTLIEHFLAMCFRKKGLSAIPAFQCDVCGAPLVKAEGFRNEAEDEARTFDLPVRVEERKTIAGTTYAVEYVDCKLLHNEYTLNGLLRGDEGLIKWLEGKTIFIGTGTQRGYGKMLVRVKKGIFPDGRTGERICTFNETLKELAKKFASSFDITHDETMKLTMLEGKVFFSITLLSPLLIPSGVSAAELFLQELKKLGIKAEFVFGKAQPMLIGGINRSSGIPKELMSAITQGSVVVFSCSADARIEEELEAMEQSGVGMGTQDGFGEIKVCDPFHYRYSR